MDPERYDDQFTSALSAIKDKREALDLGGFEHGVWSEIAIRDGAGLGAGGTSWFSALPTSALVACCVVAMALGSLIGLSRAQAYNRESSLAVERRYVESIHPVMMSVDHSGHDH